MHAEGRKLEEDKGWVRIWRKLFYNPIFKDSEALHLFLFCLLKANYQQERILFNQEEITLERGQFLSGRKQISKETGITQGKVRRRLKLLKNLGMIASTSTNKFSIITVCNYDYYQSIGNEGQPAKQPAKTKSEPESLNGARRPASDQQATTDKNNKNIKHYVESSNELRLAAQLLEEIKKNQPTFKQPNLQVWAKEIYLTICRDGRTPDQIREVILWCQHDPFWWKNVLSPSKLRKQFDRLEAEMVIPKGKSQGKEIPQVEYTDLTGGGRP